MLTTLRIKNLALVQDLSLELSPGYNAITGETGAGKSVIMGALNLVLGERADRNMIRAGADNCSVEAVFTTEVLGKRIDAFLEEKGLEVCEDGQLVIKRSFTAAGTNKQFINGSPTTISVLSSLGEWLVDMHGPHEHQSLLHPARQLQILDAFGGLNSAREEFGELLKRRARLVEEKAALIVDEKTYAQQLDLLRFQVKEISGAKLVPEAEEQLEAEYNRASNGARLVEVSQMALGILADDDGSVLTQAGAVGRQLQELARLDAGAENLLKMHEEAVALLSDLQRELGAYAEGIEVNPERLGELEERLNLVQALKRKYGSSLAEVIEFGNQARQKLMQLESRDEEVARLNAETERIEETIWKSGQDLSKKRKALLPKLEKGAVKELRDLGFKQSSFEIAFKTGNRKEAFGQSISSSGFDVVEFQFAPNPGEPSRPLRAIASSGELARVMLALKTVLAAEDEVPVLVFDEVDANVGGETAVTVGEKMGQIGAQRQVLCITHLAPVAAAAEHHWVVSKEVKEGRTVSTILPIKGKERVTELARMLGGQGEAARKHAEALLKS